MRTTRLILAVAIIFWLGAAPARAGEALIAVAANFAGAFDAIAKAFEVQSGHNLVITTGASGKLYAQISQGAPFMVMLSADAATPEKLETGGFGIAGTRFTYATGKLALWSRDAGRIGPDARAALTDSATLNVAIANPELAPYGAAARESLENLGLWEMLQPKIVQGENIGQTFALVHTGAAQMGFVALSAVIAPDQPAGGSRLDVAPQLHAPIRQDAILLKAGEHNEAAIALLEFLKSAKAREIAAAFGYGWQ